MNDEFDTAPLRKDDLVIMGSAPHTENFSRTTYKSSKVQVNPSRLEFTQSCQFRSILHHLDVYMQSITRSKRRRKQYAREDR